MNIFVALFNGSKVKHPGIEAKKRWLLQRIVEGQVFRKLDAKGCAFIEYAPLEKAWVPIQGIIIFTFIANGSTVN